MSATCAARARAAVTKHQGPAALRTRRRRYSRKAYLYLLPAFAVFAFFLGVPTLQTVQYSFYEWDGISSATAVGFQNYMAILQDPELSDSFLHVGVLIVFYAAIPVVLGLLLTMVISRAHALRGMSVFRTVLFLPQVIASVVVATIWVSIYSQNGLLNQLLDAIGLRAITRVWLGDYGTALFAIGFVGTWVNIGLCVVLFVSGVGNIQPEIFEAARVDGAGPLQEFFGITLPALRGQIAVALTLTVTSVLKTFDLVYVTTRGGPGTSTNVPALVAYDRAFSTGQVGSAAAVSVVLTIVIMIITALINLVQPKDVA